MADCPAQDSEAESRKPAEGLAGPAQRTLIEDDNDLGFRKIAGTCAGVLANSETISRALKSYVSEQFRCISIAHTPNK